MLAILLCAACDKDKTSPVKRRKPEAVDMNMIFERKDGTKYNLKWASFNLGASEEYETGDFFAWGDLKCKGEDYPPPSSNPATLASYWSSYSLANGGPNRLTKYCTVPDYGEDGFTDRIIILLPRDEAAHRRRGGKWRMPTIQEINALDALRLKGSEYTFEIVEDYLGSRVRGLLITHNWSRNKDHIFFPICSSRGLGPAYSPTGLYWSSSLYSKVPSKAYAMYIDYYYINVAQQFEDRFMAFPIRPVYECDVD